MEIGMLVSPWPDWMNIAELDTQAAVLVVSERILSAHAGDSIDSNILCSLIAAMVAPETLVHAWLDVDSDYIAHVVTILGEEVVKGFSPDGNKIKINPHPQTEQLLHDSGLIVLSCTSSDLAKVGLPLRFLRSFDNINRIGLLSVPKADIDFAQYPTYGELLADYQLVILAGGEHYSDCLIASKRMDEHTLYNLTKDTITKMGWEVMCLGSIQGEQYEQLYERTL